jgi:hypothetical protein
LNIHPQDKVLYRYKTIFMCDKMNYIGKSKISKLSPKPNIHYPLLRLPQSSIDTIGEMASIYETEHEGNRAFLIVLDEDYCNKRVIQKNYTTNLEKRVSELETQIERINNSIFENNQLNEVESQNEPRPGRNSNPSRLRDRQT